MSLLIEAVVFLTCAVLAVPLFSRFGLGSILGYLTAGMLIGPYLLGLISDVEAALHFGEFGVVLLLFLIGLELSPTRLWSLRRPVFLIGGGQFIFTSIALTGLAWAFAVALPTAILIGTTLSLSSTAVASQLLAEKGQLANRHGRVALSVLLFQDMAVIPLLAVVPLLGTAPMTSGGLSDVFVATAVIIGIIVFGRYLIEPLFDLVANWGDHEVFTAASLLLVVGTAALMDLVGVSMALGGFLAGVLFADSHHRNAVIADIEPFKGLLMGVFFIAIGMSVDLGLIIEKPLLVLLLSALLIGTKSAILYLLGRLGRLAPLQAIRFTASLGQGGEFAFVIFSAALIVGVVNQPLVDLMILVVTISMILTPVLFLLADRIVEHFSPPAGTTVSKTETGDKFDDQQSAVIIAGFGRMGQIVARALRLSGTHFTALDNDLEQISFVSRFGDKAFFGDATRPQILRAAGAAHAKVFVICVHDVAVSIQIAELIRSQFPNLYLVARVRNRHHAYRMREIGVHRVIRETFAGSLDMAEAVLTQTGHAPSQAEDLMRRFKLHDEMLLESQYAIRDNEAALIESSRAASREFRRLIGEDRKVETEND